jgi:hypothetical protein
MLNRLLLRRTTRQSLDCRIDFGEGSGVAVFDDCRGGGVDGLGSGLGRHGWMMDEMNSQVREIERCSTISHENARDKEAVFGCWVCGIK